MCGDQREKMMEPYLMLVTVRVNIKAGRLCNTVLFMSALAA